MLEDTLRNTVGQRCRKAHRDSHTPFAWIAEAPADGVLAASYRSARRPALRSSGKR